MALQYWAQRRKSKVGPFPTRQEAIDAFRGKNAQKPSHDRLRT